MSLLLTTADGMEIAGDLKIYYEWVINAKLGHDIVISWKLSANQLETADEFRDNEHFKN